MKDKKTSCAVDTECHHCGQPMRLEMDSELETITAQDGAEPLLFVPLVDFDKLTTPSIIDPF
jgi:hypothetical protein